MFDWLEFETIRFDMGSDEFLGQPDDDEGPIRQVTVGSFAISSELVTQSQFKKFVDETGYRTIAETEGSGFATTNGEPVMTSGLDWSTDGQPDAPVTQLCWFDAVEFCRWANCTLPTEAQWERAGHASGWGETLWQWCADFYDAEFFRDEQRVNPLGPENGLRKVLRGGTNRVTQRHHELPDMCSDQIGFRVVRG